MKYLLLILFCLSASAQEIAKTETRLIEKYYVNVGLGLGSVNYTGEDKAIAKALEAEGISNSTYAIDLGFYKTVSSQNLLGLSLAGMNDVWSDKGEELQITQVQIGPSVKHYYGDIGNAWFNRVDIGLARYAGEYTGSGVHVEAKSKYGYGVSAGGGYAFDVSQETHLEVQGLLSYRKAESKTLGVAFTFAVLF